MNINRNLSLLILIFINILFTYKYSLRHTALAWLVTIIYAVCQYLFFNFKFPFKNSTTISRLSIFCGIGLSLCYIFLLSQIDPNTLIPDRWSVITSFWDAFFSGTFPYAAKSHVGNPPGPFPSYFLIALPFYLLGDIGYLSLTGLLLMVYYIIRYESNFEERVIKIGLLLSSTSIMWELLVRSTLLINAVLILFYLTFFLKEPKMKLITLIWMGFLAGIIFSTRGIAILPMASACVYKFFKNRDYRSFVIFGSFMAVGFILTLLPFIFWDLDLFIKFNPITLQANVFIPFRYLLIFILISIPIGYYSRNIQQLIKWSGVNIFSTILVYMIYHVILDGYEEAYIESIVDISYFIFALPFLLISLRRVSYENTSFKTFNDRISPNPSTLH